MKRALPLVLLFLILFAACDDHPQNVLSRGKMEDVLYDYHIMQGIVNDLPAEEREAKGQDYMNAVFEKHGKRGHPDPAYANEMYSPLPVHFSDIISNMSLNDDASEGGGAKSSICHIFASSEVCEKIHWGFWPIYKPGTHCNLIG